jgi:phosphoglycolate phosphatase
MALAFKRLKIRNTGRPVYHFAPEMGMAQVLKDIFGSSYTPADFSPEEYSWLDMPVERVDLSCPRDCLPSTGVQGLVHSHVLEHIPGDLTMNLLQMNEAIEVGGFHAFVVPIFSAWYREDLSPELSHDERDRLFGQFDHLRSFGKADFFSRIDPVFANFEKVDLKKFISPSDCGSAAIPVTALTQLTSHSVHFYRKVSC